MITITRIPRNNSVHRVLRRTLATETVSATSSDQYPPPPQKQPTKSRTGLYPSPRPASGKSAQQFPKLPPSFGRNQILPVSQSTRALLESIFAQFDAPIRYAFAYGSGVFEQEGYNVAPGSKGGESPMLDFMFAVTHPDHFHSVNMRQHPSHYTLHTKLLGSDYVARVQSIIPGVWFNAYVPMNGVTIKYGVTTLDNMCSDLLNWQTLYLAGRMHKPLRIIKDDARVRLTQQVNLTSAIRYALLTLPPSFTETQLFEAMANISYGGDPRMFLPAENRSKVKNIVSKQGPQFRDVYHRLVVGLPGVHWNATSGNIEQDPSPQARAAHLKKLPSNLISRVKRQYLGKSGIPSIESDENAYWIALAGDADLNVMLQQETNGIVRYPATVGSLKGIVSAGLGKSIRYSTRKIAKWWQGSSPSSS